MTERRRISHPNYIPHTFDENGRLIVKPLAKSTLDALRENNPEAWRQITGLITPVLNHQLCAWFPRISPDDRKESITMAYGEYRGLLDALHKSTKYEKYIELGENPVGYLYTSARNLCIKDHRRRVRQPDKVQTEPYYGNLTAEDSFEPQEPSPWGGRAKAIFEGDALPENYRQR